MTRARDIDPDRVRELLGAGGDLFGHVRCTAWVGGLGQFATRRPCPSAIAAASFVPPRSAAKQ